MGGIHHPARLQLDQCCFDGSGVRQGAHLNVQPRMRAVGAGRLRADHAHQQAPALLQKGLRQRWSLAGAGQQPDGRCGGALLPLVQSGLVHQDVAPCRRPGL